MGRSRSRGGEGRRSEKLQEKGERRGERSGEKDRSCRNRDEDRSSRNRDEEKSSRNREDRISRNREENVRIRTDDRDSRNRMGDRRNRIEDRSSRVSRREGETSYRSRREDSRDRQDYRPRSGSEHRRRSPERMGSSRRSPSDWKDRRGGGSKNFSVCKNSSGFTNLSGSPNLANNQTDSANLLTPSILTPSVLKSPTPTAINPLPHMTPLPPQLDQNTKHARKVYLGNLPPECSSVSIQAFFNDVMNAKLPNKPPGDVIVSVYVNDQRRFAFLECRSIEEATYSLTLDGLFWSGFSLKLRRPQDFSPQLYEQQYREELNAKKGKSALAGAEGTVLDSKTGCTSVLTSLSGNSANKVFVGGLPVHMTEEDCTKLLQAFGDLRSFHMVRDRENNNESKGYAFCDFVEERSAEACCTGLNGMRIGDKALSVRRALPITAYKGGGMTGYVDAETLLEEGASPPAQDVVHTIVGVADNSAQTTPLTPIHLPSKNYDAAACSLSKTKRVVSIKHMAVPETAPGQTEHTIEQARASCSDVANVKNIEVDNLEVLVECASNQEAIAVIRKLQGTHFEGRPLLVALANPTPSMKKKSVLNLLHQLDISPKQKNLSPTSRSGS